MVGADARVEALHAAAEKNAADTAALEERVRVLELAARVAEQEQRLRALEVRAAALEQPRGGARAQASSAPAHSAAAEEKDAGPTDTHESVEEEVVCTGCDGCEVVAWVSEILVSRRAGPAALVRVPSDYYEWTLEQRRERLQAHTIHHLCKTIVMENVKAPKDAPIVERFIMVILQYSSKLDTERLHRFIRSTRGLSRKQVNFRLCSAETSKELTGYGHNAVTPIGCTQALPVIVSAHVTKLEPAYLFLGGGHVDVKLKLRIDAIAKAVDGSCTFADVCFPTDTEEGSG